MFLLSQILSSSTILLNQFMNDNALTVLFNKSILEMSSSKDITQQHLNVTLFDLLF